MASYRMTEITSSTGSSLSVMLYMLVDIVLVLYFS